MGRSQAVRRTGDEDGDRRFGPDADDTGCPFLHVDMDAFYASVEVRRRPELRGRPVIVGGPGLRSVVSAASYEARRFGVRSAMPGVVARRLCPQAVFLPPDFTAYGEASRAIMAIFRDVTPLVEPLSMDEAFLDVAGAAKLFGRPADIARHIRGRIRTEQGLPCSVGVASTKFLAKLASTRAKPDGLSVIPTDLSLDFLHPLPVAALWGVGERTDEVLRRLGLRTVRDVAQAPIGMLRAALGEAGAAHLHALAWNRDPRRVTPQHVEKSIGAETTFESDVADPTVIRRTLLALSGGVAERVRRAGQVGRTVALKVRLADFRTLNRSRTLPTPTDVAREVFSTAWALFEALPPGGRIRLVGVRLEGLAEAGGAARQLALDAPERGWREAEQAADAVADRFGSAAVRPASLLGTGARGHRVGPDYGPDGGPGEKSEPARNVPLSDPQPPS
ncbi:MAG TPA: DNA polymerase IV [Micromonosporaceae bacterium]|nr:DNA polymerase IV [Micromonosporaceae bacterium]